MVNARNEFKNNPSLSSNDQVKKDDVTTSSEGFADNHVPIHSRKIRQTPFQFRSQTTNDQRPKSDNNEITMYSAENNEMLDLFSQLDKLKEFITSSPSTSQSTYSQRLPTNSASVHKGKNDKPEGLNF
ncbi:uncharacterized protein LOC127712774 [Mytilus californianus]|uniref:uncharacterized protein LOC127712774 n=1 Tax=Mytilus californianus TaxID=6549 RepID=UPI002247E3D6|nr:uncharacterized protein LOC127712774 [Mytilus californianus]